MRSVVFSYGSETGFGAFDSVLFVVPDQQLFVPITGFVTDLSGVDSTLAVVLEDPGAAVGINLFTPTGTFPANDTAPFGGFVMPAGWGLHLVKSDDQLQWYVSGLLFDGVP